MKLQAIKINRILIESVLDAIKLWDFLPYNFVNTGVASAVCDLFDGQLCNLLMSMFADEDPSIDYTERYDVYMSNSPSGASYRNFLHYAQLIDLKVETFRRYDFESD
jgi:hypothetical protein